MYTFSKTKIILKIMVASSHYRASLVLGVESGSGCLPCQEEMGSKHDIVASGRDISFSG